MDGFKEKLKFSLQYRLSFWLTIIISVVALLSVALSYFIALHEAGEIQDGTLKQMAILASKNHINVETGEKGNKESGIMIQYLIHHERKENAFITLSELGNDLTNGFHQITIKNQPYRVLIHTLPNQQKVAIAQPTKLRDDAAKNGALLTILPMILLLPISLIAIFLIVRQSIKPITELAVVINNQKVNSLAPLSVHDLPIEISPFIVAINHLLARVAHSLEIQRRFVANAAHELRSPFTALSLQAERLADIDMSASGRERLQALRNGIERSRILLIQLLTFARAEVSTSQSAEMISVHQTFTKVLEDLITLAEAKHIDIGVRQEQDVTLQINEVDLITIIKNLVDNAIKFTPEQGHIDLSVQKQGHIVVIEIEDSGCGIPDTEKDRVFDAFYRVLGNATEGSGLGLSIVKTLLNRVGGQIVLSQAENSSTGLKVKLIFNT